MPAADAPRPAVPGGLADASRPAPRPSRADAPRPADLARLVGVSTQQIRNYADAGILPPAGRTPAGYRRFTPAHRAALLAYRALLPAHGPRIAKDLMLALHTEGVPTALALLDAAHGALHEERLSLRDTGRALEAVAREESTGGGAGGGAGAPAGPGALHVGELAARIGVRASALRVWEAAGLLAPARERGTGYRVYGPADARDARMIALLRRAQYPLERVGPVLEGLRATGSSDALRAAVAERQASVTRRAAAMLEAAALLHAYVARYVPDGGPVATRSDPAASR